MITIVDYAAGNIMSVKCALRRLGAEYELSSDPKVIADASKLILPGVGNASVAMADLRTKGLDSVIRELRKPVLGICVGMQLLCRYSEEGNIHCMGLFDNVVRRFVPTKESKVPHMGWDIISNLDGKLFKGVEDGSHVYFVHSFHADLSSDTIATCRHAGVMYSAALKYENFYGVQFHPEKSGTIGEMILKNFLNL